MRDSSAAFIKNAWYVAAWDYEVLPDTILERTVLGQSVIIYRSAAGSPIIMENRCCHRAAPLALGRKEGDCIRCMYHGLKFAPSGECVEIPGQERIPAAARVKTFRAVQRTRWIWVWMGDPAKSDPSLIPDTFSIQHPQWRSKPGYKNFGANILLLTDNLLDFVHLSYVHEKTFGGTTDIAVTPPQVTGMGKQGVRIVRHVRDTPLAPYHQRLVKFTGNVNRWWEYTLSVSGMFIMNAGAQSVDKSADDLEGALLFHSCQALTPQDTHSTHYFFSHAHNFALDDPTVTEAVYQSVVIAFEEDRRMIEAQSRIIEKEPTRPMLAVNSDGALVRYRRLVAAALEEEAAPAATASGI